jgi:hypothetical protein
VQFSQALPAGPYDDIPAMIYLKTNNPAEASKFTMHPEKTPYIAGAYFMPTR